MWYLKSLTDGTLGYSFKKEAVVADLIKEKIGATLQITLPAVFLSSALGLLWGMAAGYYKKTAFDRLSGVFHMVLNAVPSFLLALTLIILLCIRHTWLPYTGLSSRGVAPGMEGFFMDRLRHLALPVLTITLGVLPSRYLLMRNAVAAAMDEKYVLYARQRGLSPFVIRNVYILKNTIQPFLAMLGMSVGLCVGGSLVVENIFSIQGMGRLLTDAVYTLDYPLMQGILFVSTGLSTLSLVVTDLLCILLDPRTRKAAPHE